MSLREGYLDVYHVYVHAVFWCFGIALCNYISGKGHIE